jgi:hypothetical protein
MHQVAFDEGPQLRTESPFGDQIDRGPLQVLEKELQAEVARGSGRAVELDQHIDIAVRMRLLAGPEPNSAMLRTPKRRCISGWCRLNRARVSARFMLESCRKTLDPCRAQQRREASAAPR